LRVRVVRAENLVAKDRNGTSDPYVPFYLRSSSHGRA
jgi:Ca2+-dependent lipid-binding protein